MRGQDAVLAPVQGDHEAVPAPPSCHGRAEAHSQDRHAKAGLLVHPHRDGRPPAHLDLAALRDHGRHACGLKQREGLQPRAEVLLVEAVERHVRPERQLGDHEAREVQAVLLELPVGAEEARRARHAVTHAALLRGPQERAVRHRRHAGRGVLAYGAYVHINHGERAHVGAAVQDQAPVVRLVEGRHVPVEQEVHHELRREVHLS
mmetsp:Transcript_55568/g.162420  ORF Transcript_55568/g.162420 Transcript_55568/m.162420 type:complete len:205 (+) Transcript_55568:357-971(+)